MFRFHPTVPSSCLTFSSWPYPHAAHITPLRIGHTCHRSSPGCCYHRFSNTRYIVVLSGLPIALYSQRPAGWMHSENHLFRSCAYCRSWERWMSRRWNLLGWQWQGWCCLRGVWGWQIQLQRNNGKVRMRHRRCAIDHENHPQKTTNSLIGIVIFSHASGWSNCAHFFLGLVITAISTVVAPSGDV